MIQQNITIFLGADYIILGNQRTLKQQQQSCLATRSSSQHFSFFTGGVNFRLIKPGDLFQYIKIIAPCIPSQPSGII